VPVRPTWRIPVRTLAAVVVVGVAAALLSAASLSLAGAATGGGSGGAHGVDDGNANSTSSPEGPTGTVEVVRVVPNPVTAEDRGESVTLSVPPGTTLGQFVLDDGEQRVRLPNRTVGGRVTLTADPDAVRNRSGAGTTDPDTDAVAGPPGTGAIVAVALPALANGGEDLQLLVDGVVVDSVGYRDAPESAAYRPEVGSFSPLGATTFPVRATGNASATAYVLPDAPEPPVAALREANERLLLAGYTLTSERVADALVAATERGVRVRVLVEGGPVGGLTHAEARTLDRLVAAGVDVRLVGGPHARYAFHHPKYAVADDRAVVLTENWKPSGVGGNGSRGWGVTVRDDETAAALARTFHADFGARGARSWSAIRPTRGEFRRTDGANGSYPTRFEPRAVPVEQIRVLVAPDNAERAVVRRIDAAEESVRVLQATVGGSDQPFVRALVRAARRGVSVRLLLDGAWYAREENRAVARALNERAASEGLDLEARIADPRGRYGTVHAKGLVVDGETAILGSLNWNNHSARENREVVLTLRSRGAARYFGRVFRADWRGGAWRLPVGLLGVLLVAVGGALSLGRGIEFEARENEDGAAVAEDRVGW
jgi:phosphatidylserine/phosphatidylglycerophosphate/cardiolipin synthase-like enzyme